MREDYSDKMVIKGSKIAELAYMHNCLSQPINNDKDILIIGEREGREGVSMYAVDTLDLDKDSITCTDISELAEDSYLSDLVNEFDNAHFIKADFTEYEDVKFDYIVCISVLEHFGMKYGNRNMFGDDIAFDVMDDDYIRWNHDIRGLLKMCDLLKNNQSKAIITVPAGGYMNYDENGFPFLRYYNLQRRDLIHKMISEYGYNIYNEKFYISQDFQNWEETNISVMDMQRWGQLNPHSPNALWCFEIGK